MSSHDVVQVDVKLLLPTSQGAALFLGNHEKIFVIYVDPLIGHAIHLALHEKKSERPLTHDLICLLLSGIGGKVLHIVINDYKDSIYYCRIIFQLDNELQYTKIIELDARPSDSITLALRNRSPIYVAKKIWESLENISETFYQITTDSNRGSDIPPSCR